MITPCSSGLERSLRELHYLVEQDGWWELQAVRRRAVYVIDHNYFSRQVRASSWVWKSWPRLCIRSSFTI